MNWKWCKRFTEMAQFLLAGILLLLFPPIRVEYLDILKGKADLQLIIISKNKLA